MSPGDERAMFWVVNSTRFRALRVRDVDSTSSAVPRLSKSLYFAKSKDYMNNTPRNGLSEDIPNLQAQERLTHLGLLENVRPVADPQHASRWISYLGANAPMLNFATDVADKE